MRFEEILELVLWMRAHNQRHPNDPVRFAQPPETHRNLGGHLRERLGSGYRSIGLAFHLSGGSLSSWFDVVIHTEEVTPARPL